jgi:TetR/AcrR family transcriptional repressor of nem operon
MARPREFDQAQVVKQLIQLFWEKGFQGTSMDDLTKATGLNKGSLYSCFGNKEDLFELAINEYASQGPFRFRKSESAMTALRDFYRRIISEADLPEKQRRGCFVFNSCLEFGNKSAHLTPVVMSAGERTEECFLKLIQEAKENGEIPSNTNIRKAAQRAFATSFTIREMAKFKPDRAFLTEIANATLASFGTKKRV